MRTIGAADQGRNNNFNLIRMLAAATVLVSHGRSMVLGALAEEPLAAQIGYSWGIIAVTVFFAISGYFITKSFDRRAMLVDFIAARICRIFPGLLCMLAVSAFLLGPAFTDLPLRHYFAQTGPWLYVPQNGSLLHQQFALPGVFARNPITHMVNPSLWTLKYEVGCYAAVVFVGLTGLLRPRFFPVVLVAAAAGAVIVPGPGMDLAARLGLLAAAFAVGAGAYIYRAYVPISIILALGLFALAAMLRDTRLYPFALALSLGYAAITLGFADLGAARAYNRLGDYSYGLYIYAYPVGQALVAALPGIGVASLVAANLAVALACAMLSWRLIESPALAHRHRLAARMRLARLGGRQPALVTVRDQAK